MSDSNSKTLVAALPCYNEQDDIESLVNRWLGIKEHLRAEGYKLRVHCIDDKSTDNTNAVIRSLSEVHPDCVFLEEHEVNKGLGGALMTGFNLFVRQCSEGDLLVIMDGDDTHDPAYVLDMLPLVSSGADCVIASRYRDGSETHGVSPIRLFMSSEARVFYTLILGIKGVRDYTCGYRMYTYRLVRDALDTYGAELVERRTFACMMEVLYKMSRLGVTFAEVPFKLRYDRKQGDSKMRVVKTAADSIGTAISLRLSGMRMKRKRY